MSKCRLPVPRHSFSAKKLWRKWWTLILGLDGDMFGGQGYSAPPTALETVAEKLVARDRLTFHRS